MQVSLNVQEQKEDTEDILKPILLLNSQINIILKNQKDQSVIAESQLLTKEQILTLKKNSSEEIFLTTRLSETLDQVSILKEKALIPFWTPLSKEISKKLWLPTKIDCVGSVLNSSNDLLPNPPMGKSWFSIKKKHPLKKNSLMTSFQSSQFSLPDSMDSEATHSKKKSNKKQLKKATGRIRTLKIRLFPTKEEKVKIQLLLDQYRWYYNATVAIIKKEITPEKLIEKESWSFNIIRDMIRKYDYEETELDGTKTILKDFIKRGEDHNEVPIPQWWIEDGKSKVHSRVPRGASNKFTQNLNSGISNLRAKNISSFKMKFMSKKDPSEYVHFEDLGYPSFIRTIKSNYWFRTKTKKKKTRKKISFEDICKQTKKRGLELVYEKLTDRYFIHYPVEEEWFPDTDVRTENQGVYEESEENRLISLDPGIRKFMVGYDPKGESVFIGENAQSNIIKLLLRVDKYGNKKDWIKIKNMISEMHWKSISFLIKNYDTILLPDFRISKMIRSNQLGPMTKRMMCMFSFFSFKTKLQYKCKRYNKNLIIVNESYTSCTCGSCGEIKKDLDKSEVFECNKCKVVMDRDASGSRNILLKHLKPQ